MAALHHLDEPHEPRRPLHLMLPPLPPRRVRHRFLSHRDGVDFLDAVDHADMTAVERDRLLHPFSHDQHVGWTKGEA